MQPFLFIMYRLPGYSLCLSLPLPFSARWCYITKDRHPNESTQGDCYQPVSCSNVNSNTVRSDADPHPVCQSPTLMKFGHCTCVLLRGGGRARCFSVFMGNKLIYSFAKSKRREFIHTRMSVVGVEQETWRSA